MGVNFVAGGIDANNFLLLRAVDIKFAVVSGLPVIRAEDPFDLPD